MSQGLWEQEPLAFKKGSTMRVNIRNGAIGKTKIHIVGTMKDEGVDVVVYRWWVPHKKCWRHEAETARSLSYTIRFWKLADADEKKRAQKRTKKS